MSELTVKTRKRGVQLDPALVKLKAQELGISDLRQFQEAYDKVNNLVEGIVESAPDKAWKGIPLDPKFANKVAKVFGLNDYYSLLYVGENSSWDALLHNPNYQCKAPLFEWGFDDEQWRNIDLRLLEQGEEDVVETFCLNSKWQLYLYGKPNEHFAVFLLSQKQVSQILPSSNNRLPSTIPLSGLLVVPEEPILQFDQHEGLGKRTLVVIRAEHIPLIPRSQNTGHLISQLELEQFAINLQQRNQKALAVEVFSFRLVAEPL